MAKARRRRLLTLLLVAAVLTAGLLGTVDATQQVEQQQLTTGHSTFADGSTTFNSCFAGLAGALFQRVTWFNGQTLFSRMDSGGEQWVYVTESLVDDDDGFNESTGFRANVDPSGQTLYRTDNTYKFNDKNEPSKEWIVREYFELRDRKTGVNGVGEVEFGKEKFYVFVVQVADHAIEDPTLGKDYNFAMVIDTCRFYQNGGEVEHEDGQEGETGDPAGQHESDTTENGTHPHGTYAIDIWVGGEPSSLLGEEAGIPDSPDGSDGGESS